MKGKFLKLNKACSEKWENMKPNEKGSFCDVCSKNVVDFTQLSQLEISEKIKNSKGKICARLTKKQLETPLVDFEIQKKYKLPYSNIAASLLLASTLAVSHTAHAQNEKAPTEFVETTNLSSKSNIKRNQSKPKTTSSDGFITFKGKVNTEKGGKSVENAKITFVTVQKMLSTYSLADGSFSLEIPVELIDNDNVIRVSYEEAKVESEKASQLMYDNKDYVLSKKQISSEYSIDAYPLILVLGDISHVSKGQPLVILDGKKISSEELTKARQGKVKNCNLETKDFLYFGSEAAVAIYGKEAKEGLFILIDKPKK